MESDNMIKNNLELTKSIFHRAFQNDILENFDESYIKKPRFSLIEREEDLDYFKKPYTIEEIILLRKRIDKILQESQELASYQSVTLLNQLYSKIRFKMALLTLIRSKPIAAVHVIGLSIMALSVGGFLLNILFREPLISPFLVLYFFCFGLLMTGMAILQRWQIRSQRKAI